MKKTILFASLFSLLIAVNAQETKPVVTSPTVDSIAAKYQLQQMPDALTLEQVFPVIGEYQPTASSANESVSETNTSVVKITLDDQNKGLIWIEGLPQGKIKAMLRQSPSTYKIPAQKSEEGNDIKEGTLIFDKDTKTISVIIGKSYNAMDPASAFLPATEEPVAETAKTKGKKQAVKKAEKPWVFVGTKVEHDTASK